MCYGAIGTFHGIGAVTTELSELLKTSSEQKKGSVVISIAPLPDQK